MPLGIVALFTGYGLTIPEYQHEAGRKREFCEALVGPMRKDECRRIYDRDLAAGRANAGKPTKGYEAPVNHALVEAAAKTRAAEDAVQLKECQRDIASKKGEYQRLMAKGEYWSASLVVRRCAELQNDPALKALVSDAEQRQYIMEIESAATTVGARREAVQALLRDYPDTGKKYEKYLKK